MSFTLDPYLFCSQLCSDKFINSENSLYHIKMDDYLYELEWKHFATQGSVEG